MLDDRLGNSESHAVEAHVETCAGCQLALERLTDCIKARNDPERMPTGHFLRLLERTPPANVRRAVGRGAQAQVGHAAAGVPKQLARGDSTIDGRGSNLPPAEQPCRMTVALIPGSAPPSAVEIQDLLRRRLRAACLIVLAAFGVMFLLVLCRVALQTEPLPPMMWLWLVFGIGAVAAGAVLTALLRSRRPLSLAQLRTVELTLFATFAAPCVWKQMNYLHVARSLVDALGEPGVTILSGYHGLFWFALLTFYGLFIPNTWRRCAVVVGLIAACPFVVVLVQACGPGLEITGRPLLYYLTALGFWVLFGAALAVFGSHHFQVLRRAASAARRLGQYRLKEQLGAGGMGEVYLAEHMLLKRPCAIKLIRPERAGDPKNLLRFEREVQATATLTHPNIVEIYDYGHAADGTFYYVMEYLAGLSLDELVVRNGPLPPARTIHLLRQVCGALQEAHSAGLIHRDIKPSNILVCKRGGAHDMAKLLDFGLVQAPGLSGDGQKLTQEGAIAGTPAYMSPEQGAGKAELDARSDIYSLGAVAYFLLTGQPPFVRNTAVQTLAAHLSEPVAWLDLVRADVPADLQAVVLRCLEKEPARRYQSAEEVEQALARCDCSSQWTGENARTWWVSDFLVPRPEPGNQG